MAPGLGDTTNLNDLPVLWKGAIRESFDGAVLDLYELNGRWFEPTVARFIAEDPTSYASGQTNLYVLTGNDPFADLNQTGIDWSNLEGLGAFTTYGSAGFGFIDSITFGIAYGDDIRSQTNNGYFIGAALGVGVQIAGAALTGGTTLAISGGLRAGGVAGALTAARAAGTARSVAALGYAGYAAAGDAVGVYQSSTALANGTFTPLDLLGFAPTIGYAGSLYRGAKGTLRGSASVTGNTISSQRIATIRDALTDSNGRLLSRAERQGLKFTIRRVEAQGFRLDGGIKFNGNQGIDLAFSGTGKNAGRFALAEAKKPAGLGSLSRDRLGIRQGSFDFFSTRLRRAGRNDLRLQLESGNVDLFGGFQRSGRLFQFDPFTFIRDVNFRTRPGVQNAICFFDGFMGCGICRGGW